MSFEPISREAVRVVLEKLGGGVDPEAFWIAINSEREEHSRALGYGPGSLMNYGRMALSRLKEDPEYYTKRRNPGNKLDEFMKEYNSETWENPVHPRTRGITLQNEGVDGFVVMEITTLRPPHWPPSVHISSIISSDTKNGFGSFALDMLCALADKHGVTMTLAAKSFGTVKGALTDKQLKQWYQRRGFKFEGDEGTRQPVRLNPAKKVLSEYRNARRAGGRFKTMDACPRCGHTGELFVDLQDLTLPEDEKQWGGEPVCRKCTKTLQNVVARGNPQSIILEPSPLSYKTGGQVNRLSYVDTDAPPPIENAMYFAPTTTKSSSGRSEHHPGASEGVVSFLDFEELSDGGLFIHYMATRNDQRQKSYAGMLVAELYTRNADAKYIDWGKIMHDAAEKMFREYKRRGSPPTYGKI